MIKSSRTFMDGMSTSAAHGMLLGKDDKYYLLSAAHVLVDLRSEQGDCDDFTITLQWNDERKMQFTIGKTSKYFLTKKYVEKGIQDIGLVELHKKDSGVLLEKEEVRVATACVGDYLTSNSGPGRRNVYVGGTCLAEEKDTDGRMLVHAVSAPGCSGSALFNNDKELCGFVHGYDKHKHGRPSFILPAESKTTVYADLFHPCEFFPISGDNPSWGALIHAELLDPDLAAKPNTALSEIKKETELPDGTKKHVAFITGLAQYLGLEVEDSFTCKGLMKKLSSKIWGVNGPGETRFWKTNQESDDPIIDCYFPALVEESAALPQ